jgi:aryl carrier-like protein
VERPQAVGSAAHVLVVGGEQLSATLLRRWKRELLPAASFVNEYGPTEAVVGCSVWWLRDETELQQLESLTAAPIGRPIANTELYVLGAGRQLLPWQSVGELYIGGAGVARGYLNQPELSQQRFIASPFSEGRLYRTGDLVRWLPDGELLFIGRSDAQVKLRGFRIELGEIEQQLERLSGVTAAVVLAREDEPDRKRLVAYVVPDDYPADEEAQELLKPALVSWYRDELALRLPFYMVPTDFVLLAELPLTPNGKVDRRALPAPDGESQLAAYVAPRNEIEQALCEVWQEVLNRDQIGIEDNFFSLGGDSILSIRVVALLKSRGIGLGINDIFQHQTIALLAAQAGAVESEAVALEPFALLTEAERAELSESYIYEDAYPMSSLQTGMVFHTQLEQFSGVYHDIVVEHVKCVWEQESFEQALTACVEEHPVLRTVFRLDGERPLQLVRRAAELPLEVVDLREQAAAEQQVQEWVEARKRHVFDWEQGPLWQLNIFLRTDESFQFVLSFHHAVLDGWSRAVLTTELYNRYQQLLLGQEPEQMPRWGRRASAASVLASWEEMRSLPTSAVLRVRNTASDLGASRYGLGASALSSSGWAVSTTRSHRWPLRVAGSENGIASWWELNSTSTVSPAIRRPRSSTSSIRSPASRMPKQRTKALQS